MMPPLFEERTGRFVGLTEQQVATLNPDQLRAYSNLADATKQLDAANKEAVEARDHHHASVRKLQEAEAEAKKHRWTAHNEWRSMIAAGRGLPTDQELLKGAVVRCQMQGKELSEENLKAELPPGFPLEIDDGNNTAPTLFDLQEVVSDSHIRMHEAEARQRDYRGRVAAAITQWQVACDAPATFEDLVRSHIQSENRLRAERVANGEVRTAGGRPGRSVVDQFAAATRASGRRAGGGNSFRRGPNGTQAYSAIEAAKINAQRAAQAKAK